jgi:hypothetical protein
LSRRERKARQREEARRREREKRAETNSAELEHLINRELEVRFADGELERLGIVNIDPYDLNGQSKLYARFVDKRHDDDSLTEYFGEFGTVQELYSFKDEKGRFNGTCFIKFAERAQAIKTIGVLNAKYSDLTTALRNDKVLNSHVDQIRALEKRVKPNSVKKLPSG